MRNTINIFWFRRDLRLDDNRGLFEALKNDMPIVPIFIFDKSILNRLPKNDARVSFIYNSLQKLNTVLHEKYGTKITFLYDTPEAAFKKLIKDYNINTVYTNHDYEPYARERDHTIQQLLAKEHISFKTFKDHVVFETNEVVKDDGLPYKVYTPYMRKWKAKFNTQSQIFYESETLLSSFYKFKDASNLSLEAIGFFKPEQEVKDYTLTPQLIQNYEDTRNFPAKDSTSYIGAHLRFGTVSIRKIVEKAIAEKNEVFWQELIWREFFMQILWHFPHTKDRAFKPKYDSIQWRNNEEEFKLWCQGNTGYPLVDAGMRQLNQTGFMHNRIRMLVGSFLCKHLLIDWRWGEAYFAEKLHDYEMASNVGNWQWVAGCGVDAAPYFRIFNPITQIKKFDVNLEYIKKWAPDFQELTYPKPIVEHKTARERCLVRYKAALK